MVKSWREFAGFAILWTKARPTLGSSLHQADQFLLEQFSRHMRHGCLPEAINKETATCQ